MYICRLHIYTNVKSIALLVPEPYNVKYGGARGVMVIVTGNGHGDASSNPGQD